MKSRYSNAVYLTALVAHLPMFLNYAQNTWRKGHYQFFPLLIAVVGWIMYERLSSYQLKKNDDSSVLVNFFLGLNGVFLLAAALMFSPFWMVPALMFLSAAFIADRFGKSGFLKILPVWLLTLFIVPLPGNLDVALIQRMQFFASQLASWILDSLGQIHFREGVVLVTEKQQFLTEEACSGIRSLYSSLAAIGIYGVVRGYGVARQAFNFVQTLVWVLVGNALRVAIVVYVSDNWTSAIASGTNHEMLGLGVFVLIFVLSLSTDRAIDAFEPLENEDLDPNHDSAFTDTVIVEPVVKRSNDFKPAVLYSLIGLFIVIGIFSCRLYYVKELSGIGLRGDAFEIAVLEKTDLPDELQGWAATGFEFKARSDASVFAPESYLWTYQKGVNRVTISVDGPYTDYHNIAFCYKAIGWDIEYTDLYSSDSDSPNYTSVAMLKKNGYGTVYFSAFDRFGELIIPNQSAFSPVRRQMDVVRNIKLACGLMDPKLDTDLNRNQLPVSQIQILHQSPTEITDEEHAELEAIFLAARQRVLASPRFNAQQ